MKVGILKNENPESHINWQKSCEDLKVDYTLIEFLANNWIDKIKQSPCDLYLACPSGLVPHFKETYDKRLYLLVHELDKRIYPSYKEIILHEDKAFLSFWLRANQIDMPETYVFYNKNEALNYIRNLPLPLVFKTSMGASGSGVKFFRNYRKARRYINKAFSRKGVLPYIGPNLKMGSTFKRLMNALRNPQHVKKRIGVYSTQFRYPQKGFVILQEYIPHTFEWRVVRIGDSFFAHKKIKQGDKASGTKGIDFVAPPVNLLHYVNDFCVEFNLNCVAIDIFEKGSSYLINEVQTIFGHVQEYICEVDGKPGRYVNINGKWNFEEGLFNKNLSYNLRLENAIQLFQAGRL